MKQQTDSSKPKQLPFVARSGASFMLRHGNSNESTAMSRSLAMNTSLLSSLDVVYHCNLY